MPICELIRSTLSNFRVEEIEVSIGGPKIKIKNTYETRQIAYTIWIEMSTRKIGLPIDIDNDVIKEIYDSWYRFFATTRDLLKQVPAYEARTDKAQDIILLTMRVLNDEIRAHLTKWQARFRRWYELELENDKNPNISPQELQKRYYVSKIENYDLLLTDLMIVNSKIIEYKNVLEKIIFGKPINS